eukprot:284815307_2
MSINVHTCNVSSIPARTSNRYSQNFKRGTIKDNRKRFLALTLCLFLLTHAVFSTVFMTKLRRTIFSVIVLREGKILQGEDIGSLVPACWWGKSGEGTESRGWRHAAVIRKERITSAPRILFISSPPQLKIPSKKYQLLSDTTRGRHGQKQIGYPYVGNSRRHLLATLRGELLERVGAGTSRFHSNSRKGLVTCARTSSKCTTKLRSHDLRRAESKRHIHPHPRPPYGMQPPHNRKLPPMPPWPAAPPRRPSAQSA